MSASAHSRSSSGSSQGSDESAKAEQRLEALQKQYEDFVCQNKCFHSDLQKEMLVALHTSNYKLMDVIYKLDIGDNNAAKAPTRYDQGGIQVDRATAMKLGLGVLNGLPHEVKQAMILGTLGELAFPRQGSSILPTTPELSSSSVETKKQSGMSGVHEYSPDIYAHVFCHADGRPMLVSQMQHVLDCLERYKDQLVDNGPNDPPSRPDQDQATADFIGRVDGVQVSNTPKNVSASMKLKNSVRRYLTSWGDVLHLESFVAGWRAAIKKALQLDPNVQRPLPWGPTEVGWTIDSAYRGWQYKNHISSVEIMSLFDSVCRAFCAGIAMRFRVVYRCLDPTLPRMAEHIISRLCFSYNFHGDALPGFNSHIAGLSNYSNRYLTVGIYDKVKEEAAYAGVFLPTCEREQQLAEEALRAMRLAKQWDEKKKRAEELRQEVRASEKKLHDAEDRHRLALQRFEEALPRLQAKVEKKLDAIEKAKQIHAMLDVYSTALAKIRAIEQVQRRSSEKSEEL